jgi:hypothetical protein
MQGLPLVEWHEACTVYHRKARPFRARNKGDEMSRYRIMDPTIAMSREDGVYVARTVAAGTIVEVTAGPIDGDKLLDAIWDGKEVMMFTQDLRSRAQLID